MATSSSAIPSRAASTTQTPPDDPSYTITAKSATSTLPSTTAHTIPAPSPLELPPPSPNLPSPPLQPPSPPPVSAYMTPACSITTTTTSNNISPTPSAHSPSATVPTPAPSPRDLKLQSQISTLQSQIANTQRSLDDTLAKLQDQISSTTAAPQPQCLSGPSQNEQDLLAHAEAIVKRHIKLLHAYNEIKDVGQGLMGLIADARGVRLKEVMEEMGIGEKD